MSMNKCIKRPEITDHEKPLNEKRFDNFNRNPAIYSRTNKSVEFDFEK